MSISENDKKHVWHPFTQHRTAENPIVIERAEGSWLFGEDGQKYLDANSSWWVNTHGHGHPHIQEAIHQQFSTLDHVVFAGVTHPKAVELAMRITGLMPGHFQRVFYSDNGSTAVEVALKMVLQFWHNRGEKKQKFMALSGSYHGDTFGAMSVGQRGYFNAPFEPLFFEADYLDFPTGENDQEILQNAERWFASGKFAGLIVEPLVQGAAGMRMYSPEFLDVLVQCAKKYDVKVIFDEVMTGFGRTGKMFAMDHCQEKPDLVALSKGVAGGTLPMGLTVTGNDMYEAFLDEQISKAFLHGHSFTANPIICAAACASLDLFEQDQTWKNIESIGEWNRNFASELAELKCIDEVRQTGTILAFEIDTGEESGYFSSIREQAYRYFLDNELLIRPLGNVIFVNPPYCITKEEHTDMSKKIIDFLRSL